MEKTIKMSPTSISGKKAKLTGTQMRANIKQRQAAMTSKVSKTGVVGLYNRRGNVGIPAHTM